MWLLWLLIKYLILGHPPTKGGHSSTLDDIYIYIEKQRLASTCTATLLQSHALGFLLVDLEYCQPFHSYFSHASWCKLSIYSPWLPQAQMICIIFAGYVSQIRSQIFFRAPLQCLWARSWKGSIDEICVLCYQILHLSASPITITFRPQLTPSEIARTPCERRRGSLPAHKIWFKSLISYLMNWCVMWYCNISMYLCHAVRCNISRYRIEDYYYKLQPWTDAELFGCNQFRWERWLRYCHWHEIWCCFIFRLILFYM